MLRYHESVLLEEAVGALNPTRLRQVGLASAGRDAWYLDLTLGDGGHSIEIIKRGGKVVGVDVDPEALDRARERFKKEGISEEKYKLVLGNFRDIKNLITAPIKSGEQTDIADQLRFNRSQKFDGAIFDLGVSSLQLETPERGFSFGKMGPLDMRMDPSLAVKALDLVNGLSRKELYELFSNLGEEKYSWHLANTLVRAREVKEVETTTELSEIVTRAIRGVRGKIHPATKVFQALRMVVNDELGALQEGLDQVQDLIKKNGRIVVISFHSLEDRIVKNTFKQWGLEEFGETLTKKPIVPTDQEILDNPRSRSAKMRVFKIL